VKAIGRFSSNLLPLALQSTHPWTTLVVHGYKIEKTELGQRLGH
jgi:hypothetical protein